MIEAALNFSKQMVEARMKPRPVVDKEREERDCQQMKTTVEVFAINQTIKKIKAWKTK